MSHAVKIAATLNFASEKAAIENLEQYINKINADVYTSLSGSIKDVRDRINKLKQFMEDHKNTMAQDGGILPYRHQFSSLVKDVSNLREAIKNYDYLGDISNQFKMKDEQINNLLMKFGSISTIAMSELHDKGEPITVESLSNKIDEIRNEEQNNAKFNMLKLSTKDMISKLSVPKKWIEWLGQDLLRIKTPQELTDFQSYVIEKETQFVKMKNMLSDLKSQLTAIGFTIDEQHVSRTSEGKFNLIITAKNRNSKNIDFVIGSDSSLEYQLGNYEGHLCEGDSDKLRVLLKENSKWLWDDNSIIIERNISNDRPLYKAAVFASKEGNK